MNHIKAWDLISNHWTSDYSIIRNLDIKYQCLIYGFWYCSEVSNGGSEQFYLNHSDEAPRLLSECLKMIQFDQGVKAVQQSWSIFKNPHSQIERCNDMKNMTTEQLERHFQECESIIFENRQDGLEYRFDIWASNNAT